MAQYEYSVIGKRLPRADAVEKVRGQVIFSSDIQLPGMLHAKFLRSPHAHARIIRIDTTKAEALDGVKCVLTHQNVPRIHPRNKLDYLLSETVHCPGEEVAVVAAVAEELAEEALRLIDVEYEVFPAVFEVKEALKPGAPLANIEYGSNLYHGTDYAPIPRCTPEGWLTIEYNDVDKGFEEAEQIVEGSYETAIQYNCSPLPRSVICRWAGDELTCWCDTQIALVVQQDLARCLDMPQSKVRVISTRTVGGYGSKEPEKTATLVALLAQKTDRPVKAVYTRDEDVIATHRSICYDYHGKVGVKKDGTITALQSRMFANWGRDSKNGAGILSTSGANACMNLYEWQSSKWEGCNVITNIVDCGALNSIGSADGDLCVERLMDEAVEAIDMDPVEFRLKNCMKAGDKAIGGKSVTGGPVEWGIMGPDIDSFPECIRKVAESTDWKKKWQGWKTPVAVNGSKRRGIGIAIGTQHTVISPASATVKMSQDGTATVLTMGAEIGQGFLTAMIQVVAETLTLGYEDVKVITADTGVAPPSTGNVGSQGVSSIINAAKYAADDVCQKFLKLAAAATGSSPENLVVKNGMVCIKDKPLEEGIAIAELCRRAPQITATANARAPIIDEKTGKQIHGYAVSATVAEVEVDTETGVVNVLRLTIANDCGKAINPQLIENQMDLSVTMATGWVMSEDLAIDKKMGIILNPNLLDYKLMTILDMPRIEDMQKIIVEYPTPWGPFGAKGMSEVGKCSPAPAIANAVYNAIGVRIRGSHLTPERVLEALGK
ncbi:xanthine dehydrogenase family protein molybdopterin-binding subunit [Chloroflexota bacterium]